MFFCFCLFVRLFFSFTRQDSSVALESVLELDLLDLADLKLIEDPLASASQVLGLKVCATTTRLSSSFVKQSKILMILTQF